MGANRGYPSGRVSDQNASSLFCWLSAAHESEAVLERDECQGPTRSGNVASWKLVLALDSVSSGSTHSIT